MIIFNQKVAHYPNRSIFNLTVNYFSWIMQTQFSLPLPIGRIDQVFRALADPTRRNLVERLSASSASVSELAAPLAMSLNAVSKHLKVMESAGLIRRERAGRTHHIHLRSEPLHEAQQWVRAQTQAWEDRFDSLAATLAVDAPPEASK